MQSSSTSCWRQRTQRRDGVEYLLERLCAGISPADDLAQTVAVMGVLAASGGAMDAAGLSVGFRQGRRTIPQIEAVLAALVRMGAVRPLDGGRRFLLPRAA